MYIRYYFLIILFKTYKTMNTLLYRENRIFLFCFLQHFNGTSITVLFILLNFFFWLVHCTSIKNLFRTI